MLTVLTFLWGSKYAPEYVDRLAAGVRHHLSLAYRFVCAVDRPRVFRMAGIHQTAIRDLPLTRTETNGCLARLRLFDPKWQSELGIPPGSRVLVLDVDAIITGRLEPLIDRPEPFVILQGVNYHKGRFNGSVWLTTGGHRPDVWSELQPDNWPKWVPHYGFPNDQAWMEHMMPDAGAYGPPQVYAFAKPGWPNRDHSLPPGAAIVAFPGRRDPGQFVHLPWVRKFWLGVA